MLISGCGDGAAHLAVCGAQQPSTTLGRGVASLPRLPLGRASWAQTTRCGPSRAGGHCARGFKPACSSTIAAARGTRILSPGQPADSYPLASWAPRSRGGDAAGTWRGARPPYRLNNPACSLGAGAQARRVCGGLRGCEVVGPEGDAQTSRARAPSAAAALRSWPRAAALPRQNSSTLFAPPCTGETCCNGTNMQHASSTAIGPGRGAVQQHRGARPRLGVSELLSRQRPPGLCPHVPAHTPGPPGPRQRQQRGSLARAAVSSKHEAQQEVSSVPRTADVDDESELHRCGGGPGTGLPPRPLAYVAPAVLAPWRPSGSRSAASNPGTPWCSVGIHRGRRPRGAAGPGPRAQRRQTHTAPPRRRRRRAAALARAPAPRMHAHAAPTEQHLRT